MKKKYSFFLRNEKVIIANNFHFKSPLKTFYWLNLFFATLFLLASGKSNAQCANYQVYESIATATVPTSGGVWTQTGLIIASTNPRTGASSLTFDAAGDAITTPQIAAPGIFSFWYRRSLTNPTTPLFVIETSPDNATWTSRGTITVFPTAQTQFTVNLGALALTNVYIRIRDGRAAGTSAITVDDISWTSTTPTNNIVIPSLANCSQTISCGTTYSYTDMGGSSDNYNANVNQTITFTPSIGTNKIQLLFSAFNTESGNDGMVIYNGPTTASPIISSGLGVGTNVTNCPAGSYYGTTSPGTIISSDVTGAITIQFRSDGTIHNAGWVAGVSCFAPPTVTSFTPSNDCTNTGTVIITGTGFTGASAVSIGGSAVTSFTVTSATQITAIVGNGTTGTIAVTTAGGTVTSVGTFTVNPLPANPSNPTSNSPQCATPGVTITRFGTVPAGETWYWQTIPLGTNTTNSAATYVVSTAGTYYIRAQNNTTGCWSVASGSVTIAISTILSAAINPSPTNGATGVCYAGAGAITSVTWAATAGATSYDVYFGAGSLPGTVTANAVTNIYNTGTLLANTTYYWKIVCKNACGDAIGSSTWTFTTAAATCTSYCASTSTSSTVHFTSFSTTGGTTNVSNLGSGYSLNGYGNFTATQITTQALAGTVNFSTIISGIAGGAGVAIFVDWNQNGVFTDAGENVYNSAGYLFANPTGSFTVPAGASIGSTRMRIVTNYWSGTPVSCNSGITGETEDYTFTVVAPSCYLPTLTATLPITTTTATINWTAPTVLPSNGYQYIVSTSNVTPSGAGTPAAGLSVNITGLTPNTTYYVFVRSDCGSGDYSLWTPYGTFFTGFCSSTSTSSTYFINDFSTTGGTANINNNGSGYTATGYGNFTAQVVSQVNSGVVNFSTDFSGTFDTFGFNIWVDWNDDLDFNDAGELVYASGAFLTGASGSFTVPASASVGNHRMRIRANFLATNPSACSSITSGETEDYTFTVLPPLPCSGNPSGINVAVTSQTTANVTWTAATPAPANGYQYYLFTANTYPTGVTGSTAAGVTTINLTGLTPLTTYYIWIRSNCGGALGQGVWIGPVSFTQPNCSPGGGNGTTTLGCPYVTSGGFGLNGTDPPAIDCTTSSCVNLEATYLQLGNTTNYTVQSIPYAPPYQFNCLQNPVSVNVDDVWSPVINLPFNFCFYGNSYSSCIIGSNGILSFNTGNASASSGYAFSNNLPSTTGSLFANSIYGVYHDINPNIGGQVGWELITLNTGCRALVASWNNVPMFSNNSILYTGMMVLYENTNVIEVFIKEKNVDNFDILPWNDGNAIVGLQNATGTAAVVAPGRNGLDTNWEVSNEAWRFTPSGTSIATLKWYEGAGTTGPIVGTTAIVNVCPAATTTYTAEITYTLCNGVLLKVTDQTTVTVTNGKVWNGSVSTDWNVANNWTPSGVPTSLNCVVVPNVTNDPIISGVFFNAYGLNLTILNGATLVMNATNTLTITDFVKVEPTASFTIKNSASLIQVNNSAVNIGNIIMERMTTLRKTDYVYWSSPVQTFSAAAISPGTTTNYIYKWNPSIANTNGGLGNWVGGNDNPMILGKGYIVRGPTAYTTTPAAFTATFNGKPNNGIIQPQITRGNYSGVNYLGTNLFTITNLDDNWNLLGNPYPSAINATTFLTNNTNISGNVRLWTHGTNIVLGGSTFYATFAYNYTSSDYVSYNGTGSTPPGFNGKIGAGQGFFVTMNEATAVTENVTFNNSLRSNTYINSQFYRNNNDNNTIDPESEPERHRIWLSLVDANNNATTTLVGYVNEATNQQDRMFDAEHVAENGMGIYSMINDKAMIIQGRSLPFDQNDTVPIGVTVTNSGIYNIAISTLDGLFENQSQEIYLEDSEIGIIHDLRMAPYTFTADTGMSQSRFILRYTNDSLGNDTLNANQTFAFITNNTLHIQSKENIAEVAIYEVTGKLVKTYQPNQTVNHIESEFNFAKGVYLAKIKLESGVITAKKLMN